MREGRYAEAQIELERQVMVEPRNAGAWLDFGLTHYALGHFEESQAIFDAIVREFSPSPAILAVIANYRRPKPPPPRQPNPRRWNGDVALWAGHETNANAGLRLNSLTLTFPDTTVTTELAIDPRYQARPSSTWQVEAHAEGETPLGDSGVSLLGIGEWRDRHTPAAADFGTRQTQAFLGLRSALEPADSAAPTSTLWAVWAGHQQASLGGQKLLDNHRLLATLERPLAACQARGGGEIEWRRYPIQSALDGRYQGILGSLGCPLGGSQVFLTMRYGGDRPDAFRAGGVQTRSELAATLQRPLFEAGRLEISLNQSRQSDRESYSVLLGDIPRRIDRNGFSIEYAHGLGAGWEVSMRGETWRQASNIELFRIRSTSLLAGLRKRF
ncbi:MAG: tetratricopeptide repeat protein [Proteobacteria bacterium]|nr:tetratricopeptide repeat protein [Pseudomonadota bacterium]